jgi:flagellin
MGLFVNTNVASLNTRRNLNGATNNLGRSFQRLSSGLRINSAKDDAAGLAISTRFTSQIRGLNQAVRNTNDGISLAQTTEGALQETTNILQRIRELSVQAANDTNTSSDRESLQAEVDQLVAEVDRIAETTTFNNRNVLDGSFVGSVFHVGANARETIAVSTADARSSELGRQARFDGTAVSMASLGEAEVIINGVSIRAAEATDDTLSTSQATASAIAKASAINDSSAFTGVLAIVNEATAVGTAIISAVTLDSTNNLEINGQAITGFNVQNNDSDGKLVDAINAVSDTTGVVASLNSDRQLVLTADDGRNISVTANGAATRLNIAGADGVEVVTGGTLTLQSDSEYTLELAAGVDDDLIGHGIGAGNTELAGTNSNNSINTVDITTRVGANRAIDISDVALQQVSSIRSDLGAIQNRLESTINNLSTTSENLSASRSRIMDADFAQETAHLSKNQILQQAGVSMLAQANQLPNVALSLLG